ncbi:Fic family protein [Mycoplasmopsis gallinarum]|uniref:Fic protein n=1 Tax=Mycoplasmopsis gallinarum TaxID=29557 RepID=A0A168RRB1_9BACT|nr:Fic family protein [Mycoplasmopsis gallinarum]OAB49211.1 Fic protein [Mycoplasmopsis gallinarum]
MIKKYIYELTTYASNLENIDITIGQTKKLVDDLDDLNLNFYNKNIVLNLYQTYKKVIHEEIEYNEKFPVLTLMEINKNIGERIIIDNGKIRNQSVLITGTSYKPPVVNEELINNVILDSLYDLNIDSVLSLQCKLMKLQPFNDGNKRTSMIFTNLLLSKHFNQVLVVKDIEKYRSLFVNYYETDNNEKLIAFLKRNLKGKTKRMLV